MSRSLPLCALIAWAAALQIWSLKALAWTRVVYIFDLLRF